MVNLIEELVAVDGVHIRRLQEFFDFAAKFGKTRKELNDAAYNAIMKRVVNVQPGTIESIIRVCKNKAF